MAGLYTQAGRIVCEGEFRIYDLLGRDVTTEWRLRSKNRERCPKSSGEIRKPPNPLKGE